ncbi:MAG: hypothetical protein CMG72_02045 [Candidatus Marinimicrobia bacterium]|nr:hypothetical protein [Candidatus Neomarinimicrobiota bacterium]
MLRNLITILIVSVICFHSKIYSQDQKILLIGNCETSSVEIMLEYLQNNTQINLSVETNIAISEDNIASYPIIFICNNQYLQLSNQQINSVRKHLKRGGFFIIDNITSDYTYSLFLRKLLPEFETNNIQPNLVFNNLIFDLTFDETPFIAEGIFINDKIVLFGIKKFSLLNTWLEKDERFLQLGANIIFYYLTR